MRCAAAKQVPLDPGAGAVTLCVAFLPQLQMRQVRDVAKSGTVSDEQRRFAAEAMAMRLFAMLGGLGGGDDGEGESDGEDGEGGSEGAGNSSGGGSAGGGVGSA